MENLNNQNGVVSLASHKVSSQARIELDGVRRSLSMISWDLQTQQVLSFCGLPVTDSLLGDNVAVMPGSNAAQLGHTLLKDLVTRSDAEDGLAINWDEFSPKLIALVNKAKYQVQGRDYNEINAQVDDATNILGRKPMDIAEFHGAQQRALRDQIVTVQRDAALRSQDLQEKNQSLMRNLTEAQTEISGLHVQRQSAEREVAEQITKMTREMALNQEIFEKKSSERIASEVTRLQGEFESKMAQARSEIELLARDADNKRMSAEANLNQLQLRIDRGDFIEAHLLTDAQTRLDAARDAETHLRNQLFQINSSLTEAQVANQVLREENADLKATIEQINGHASNLELRLRDIIEDKLGSSEFAVLQERIAIIRAEKTSLEQQLTELKTSSDRDSRALHELRGRFQQMRQVGREHFQSLQQQLKEASAANSTLSASFTQAKIMVGVLVALSLVSGAGFVVKSLGFF